MRGPKNITESIILGFIFIFAGMALPNDAGATDILAPACSKKNLGNMIMKMNYNTQDTVYKKKPVPAFLKMSRQLSDGYLGLWFTFPEKHFEFRTHVQTFSSSADSNNKCIAGMRVQACIGNKCGTSTYTVPDIKNETIESCIASIRIGFINMFPRPLVGLSCKTKKISQLYTAN